MKFDLHIVAFYVEKDQASIASLGCWLWRVLCGDFRLKVVCPNDGIMFVIGPEFHATGRQIKRERPEMFN